MISYIKFLGAFILAIAITNTFAQTSANTSSPYSKYGLGDYQEPLLPLSRGLGGIGTGVAKFGGFNDINVVNPASYSGIGLATIDVGGFVGFNTLNQTGNNGQTSTNFSLSHVAFAIPVTKHSALSFGLLPYTVLGYNYSTSSPVKINNSPQGIDTSTVVTHTYSGEGGLSKGYLGYGLTIGKHLSVGLNFSYIFGNEKQYSSSDFNELPTAMSSRIENSYSAGGFNYDYGLQYVVNVKDDRRFTFGYSGSSSSTINSTSSFIVSQYYIPADGSAPVPADSTVIVKNNTKIVLPMFNRFGVSYTIDGKLLIGADYKIGSWSNLSVNGTNAGLVNNTSLAIGAQITPNINSLYHYLAVVDYRFGFNYDNSYIKINGTQIKQYGATLGLGLPIPNDRRTTFYKINFSAEVGKRGTLENSLVKETYFNFHLGFTINDKWFQKYKFD